MAFEPKVTGLSPMTGPPGTKITVRGENLGESCNDIIELTVNGADCLPYLEWKSPKKIITRCTKTLGSGDIIISTKSGGLGTCDVQFNCYEENVGLTDESAVWVNETDHQVPEKEKNSLPNSSDETNPYNYLLKHYSRMNLLELEKELVSLKKELFNKNDPEVINSKSNRAALLKSNLPVIMECLQILEHLSKVITMSRDTSIDNIVQSIKECLLKTHDVFDPLLAQKDLIQSIENAMQVFRENESLFNLPTAIENSIKNRNYDSVVKEIASVLTRLKTINIDQNLTKKIQQDVLTKVDGLKKSIKDQLHQSCQSTNAERNIEEVKKLISHLNRLGSPSDVWGALTQMSESLNRTLDENFEHYLKLCLESEKSTSQKIEPPYVVQFVQSAIKVFHNSYYDILSLGQSYFDPKDEFACKDSEEVKRMKQLEFDELIISKPIGELCIKLRLALVPDSSKLDKPSAWPSNDSDTYVDWLRHILESVITCHIQLTKVSLPLAARNALEDFKEFVFELRVRSMRILFGNATQKNKNLHHQEDWVVEVDDLHGSRTKLPWIFEKNVIDTLRFASETVFKTSLHDEKSILKRVDVQASLKELVHSLINSFIDSLDNALIDTREHPAESRQASLRHMNRLLVTICNCQFTKEHIFVRLQDEFEKFQGLKMERVFKVCGKKYSDYISKISDKFCRNQCKELNKSLREAKNTNTGDLQLNLMVVNSQIFLVAPQLVNNLMTNIVNSMCRDSSQVNKL